jgi:hypothetical protein
MGTGKHSFAVASSLRLDKIGAQRRRYIFDFAAPFT